LPLKCQVAKRARAGPGAPTAARRSGLAAERAGGHRPLALGRRRVVRRNARAAPLAQEGAAGDEVDAGADVMPAVRGQRDAGGEWLARRAVAEEQRQRPVSSINSAKAWPPSPSLQVPTSAWPAAPGSVGNTSRLDREAGEPGDRLGAVDQHERAGRQRAAQRRRARRSAARRRPPRDAPAASMPLSTRTIVAR
jgi:hypothetical protein